MMNKTVILVKNESESTGTVYGGKSNVTTSKKRPSSHGHTQGGTLSTHQIVC